VKGFGSVLFVVVVSLAGTFWWGDPTPRLIDMAVLLVLAELALGKRFGGEP